MKVRTWAIVAAALGGLLLLLALSLLSARERAQDIYARLDAVTGRHRQVEGLLRRLRSDVHVSWIFVRDDLLDTSPSVGPEYRRQLSELRGQTSANLAALERLVSGDEATASSEIRIRTLEARSQEQHERSERAEKGMRHLSQRLVGAQEDERRRLARELHDEIGQMLTAQRMELGKAERTLVDAGGLRLQHRGLQAHHRHRHGERARALHGAPPRHAR